MGLTQWQLDELVAVLSAHLEGQVPREDDDLVQEYVESFKVRSPPFATYG